MSQANSENSASRRMSKRPNKGVPPKRLGWEEPREEPSNSQNKGQFDLQMKAQEKNNQIFRAAVPSVRGSDIGHVSSRSSQHSKMSKASYRRRQIEADLQAALAIEELDEEQDKLEQKRIDRQRRLIEQRKALELAKIDEQLEENVLNLDDDNAELERDKLNNSQDSGHEKANNAANDKVEEWLEGQPIAASYLEHMTQAFAQAIQTGTFMATQSIEKNTTKNDSDMQKFLARQSTAKELPFFSGDAEEWTNFISQFRRSTEICGFSREENMYRLQKCLKGKARETVQAMMVTPENTDEVINVLEMTFGRPEYVIKVLIEKAKRIVIIKEDKFDKIIEFSNIVQNLVITMETLKCTGHFYNPLLIELLVDKLPPTLRLRWGEKVVTLMDSATLKDFSDWIKNIAKAASCVSSPCAQFDNKSKEQFKKNKETVLATSYDAPKEQTKREPNKQSNGRCLFCAKSDHDLQNCEDFRKEDDTKRWEWATGKKICFSCLKVGHQIYRCFRRKSCEVDGCNRRHHTLLHNAAEKKTENKNKTEVVINTVQRTQLEDTVLLRIAPVKLKGPLGEVCTYALFDEASTVTLVDSSVTDKLGITGPQDNLSLRWTNSDMIQDCESKRVTLEIGKVDNAESYKLTNVRTVKNLDLPVQSVDTKKLAKEWSYLNKVNVISMKNAKPTILIGQDNCDLIIAREVIEGPKNAPVMSRTKLGWIVHGNVKSCRRVDEEFVLHVYHNDSKNDELHQMVKDYFKTDTFGVRVVQEYPRSKDDMRAQKIFNETTKRIGDRWETGFLWKEDNVNTLQYNSKAIAAHRLKFIEKKMDKDENFSQQYCAKINDYLQKNFARILSPEEKAEEPRTAWYLPHFGVVNPNKPGKFRMVFDAAAKSKGKSLNDMLLQGPDLLNSLVGVIFRFRQKEIAFSADIREMFHQVRIRPEDTPAQRFLWRGQDRDRDPDVYEMTVMIFGSVSSPFQAQEVKNKNAKEFEDTSPEATRAIIYRHYMDDYLDSAHTEEEANKLIEEVIEIHRKGGFQICNWISSSREVLRRIPEQLRSGDKQDVSLNTDLAIERVLGLHWDPNEDKFNFLYKCHKVDAAIVNGSRHPTKREVLKMVMSIFDPLGFIAPFTVKAKILLQDIWRTDIGWDDELSTCCQEKWIKWITELTQMVDIKIPRCYSPQMSEARNIQLHMFCDASEKAFAAVAYFRIETEQEIHTAFVAARSRVAPLRLMSIPRLELQAAVMASRLAQTILTEHDTVINEVFYWTDSRTVMCWIHSEARKYKPFVAHRIGEIEELTELKNWNWISTKENVADEATRDGKMTELDPYSRWFNGPAFLKLPKSKWIHDVKFGSDAITPDDLEMKKEALCLTTAISQWELPDISRFSSWLRLIRTTAWTKRFVINCRRKINKIIPLTDELSPSECIEAEKMWWKKSQFDSFPNEVRLLKEERQIDKNSRLIKLSVFLDEERVLKMKGRINASELSDWTKQPVILDPKHEYTNKLLIHYYHTEAGHQGQEYVINELRQKYWILNARNAVRSVWSHCQICKNKRTTPNLPEMGPLPAVRLIGYVRPFTNAGMDYYGPIDVVVGRRHEKRYGVLFTCLSTRAVHMEIASSLSTDSAIMAVRRMVARRGMPQKIYSDNGSNLHGCDNELKRALQDLDQEKIVQEHTRRGIEWHFIPPSSPHFGGCWERLVRSVKIALKAILKERAPRDEVLQTLITEAENIVNSRPLTHVSADPNDIESLTPNHFLIGTSSNAVALGNFDDQDLCLRKQWRIAQRLADQFWKRWIREYLPTLARRTKWFNKTDPIKVGDIVVIADGDMIRNYWPRGIVTAVHPGTDGQVRVVDVKTKTGVLRRPVVKICKLDVRCDGDEQ